MAGQTHFSVFVDVWRFEQTSGEGAPGGDLVIHLKRGDPAYALVSRGVVCKRDAGCKVRPPGIVVGRQAGVVSSGSTTARKFRWFRFLCPMIVVVFMSMAFARRAKASERNSGAASECRTSGAPRTAAARCSLRDLLVVSPPHSVKWGQ